MAQTVNFKFNGITSETSLTKLNRDKVYGWSEYVYTDSDNHVCSFLTLLDGKTFIGQGGMALKSIDSKGNEIDKSTLVAHYEDESVATKYHVNIWALMTLCGCGWLDDFMRGRSANVPVNDTVLSRYNVDRMSRCLMTSEPHANGCDDA